MGPLRDLNIIPSGGICKFNVSRLILQMTNEIKNMSDQTFTVCQLCLLSIAPGNAEAWLSAGAKVVGLGANLVGNDINFPVRLVLSVLRWRHKS